MRERAERAIFDLRRGQPVRISDRGHSALVAAVEGMNRYDAAALGRLAQHPPRLVLSGQRAVALGLAGSAADAVAVDLGAGELGMIQALAGLDDTPVAFEPGRALPASAVEAGAVSLARVGRLLPAVLVHALDPVLPAELAGLVADGTVLELPLAAVDALVRPGEIELRVISEAEVPLALAGRARFVLFREGNGLDEHVAIRIGDPDRWPVPVPVRLHSSCLTGDIFGSLRCDCGEQLRGSIMRIEQLGGGLLLYLAQEGRGIGLANKLRAYSRQDGGLDTIAANHELGFPDDQRDFTIAARMLRMLDVADIVLLTNNPRKADALGAAGIRVSGQLPVLARLNPHNRRYMTTKAERSGHLLGDLLDRLD